MHATSYTLRPRTRWLLRLVCVIGVTCLVLYLTCWRLSIPGNWRGTGQTPTNHWLTDTMDDAPGLEVPDAELLSAHDFEFMMGEGGGLHGYDVVKVRADGTCEYTFFDYETRFDPATRVVTRPSWRRSAFQLDARTAGELRELIASTRYFRLKKLYRAGHVHDGTQWLVKVRAAGRTKRVYCSNHFPAKVIALSEFVRTRILDPRRDEIGKAGVVELTPIEQWKEFEGP